MSLHLHFALGVYFYTGMEEQGSCLPQVHFSAPSAIAVAVWFCSFSQTKMQYLLYALLGPKVLRNDTASYTYFHLSTYVNNVDFASIYLCK